MSTTGSTASNLTGQSNASGTDVRATLKSIEEVDLPASKDAGKLGRAIKLRTNYYRLAIAPNKTINHYDVKISEVNATLGKESVKTREEKFKFFQTFLKEKMPAAANDIAYDGESNCYYMKPLTDGGGVKGTNKATGGGEQPFKRLPFQYAPRGTRKRDFEVLLRLVDTFSSNDINAHLSGHNPERHQERIQAIDVILRHQASTTMICHGRNFYDESTAGRIDLGGGREVLSGFFQATRVIQGRGGGSLALNIDVANTAFLKQIAGVQFAVESLGLRNSNDVMQRNFWQDRTRKQFETHVKGVMFVATHLKKGSTEQRTWRCNGLSRNGAAQQQFEIVGVNGRKQTTTVADYYKRQYGITLKCPFAPCIVNGSPKNPERVKYFPLELMKVAPRQAHKGKLDEKMTSNMIRAVATPAPQRERDTNAAAKKATALSAKMASQYGIQQSATMEQVTGRVLDAPLMEYNQQNKAKAIAPRQGAWDTRDVTFHKGASINKWVLINYQARIDERSMDNFADGLVRNAYINGMKMDKPTKVFYRCQGQSDLENKLSMCQKNGVELVLVILPFRNTANYSFIKYHAEVGYGVVTQCVLQKNVERANAMFYGNLLQKINTKRGGINTKIAAKSKPAIFGQPIMVVGLSITHGSPGSDQPSIVSASFSIDAAVYRYHHEYRLQEKGVGLITKLKELMVEGCKAFRRFAQVVPKKIVVFRQGGSEGELKKIAGFEVKQCKEAFASLPGNFNPGLTFVCVNKMHHTRLFAENERDRIGKSQNVPAGTVVDSVINAKDRFDYYLNSAQGIQGTSRPTHYTLIHDDNKLSSDSLIMLTWTLCHGYARCTRSVSMPVPVFYAELIRERVGRYLYEKNGGSDYGSIVSGGHGDAGMNAQSISDLELSIKNNANLTKMYFV